MRPSITWHSTQQSVARKGALPCGPRWVAAFAGLGNRSNLFHVVGLRAKGTGHMNLLGNLVTNFLKNEDGPTAVEYAVMLALIIVVCIVAISTLGSNANTTFTNVG